MRIATHLHTLTPPRLKDPAPVSTGIRLYRRLLWLPVCRHDRRSPPTPPGPNRSLERLEAIVANSQASVVLTLNSI